ncbi:hypothetical protein ACFGVS_23660 [Mucilaginibacter sp. AW1-7]|uniref:hypothetical protein n=1 Tax=Mucilaginibacter sp. AW1-7 TaxID=3349874 RepID=UPI003F7330B6
MTVKLNRESSLNRNHAYELIFDFFRERSLNADTPYAELEQQAREFLARIDDVQKQAIACSEYSPENDLFDFSDVSSYERYNWFYGFQNFYRAVNNILKNYTPETERTKGAEPQYVLKKDAFRYVGHNESNLEHSHYGYASLFYH